ncbi:MAG TPA: TIGR01841 family phasin [Caldimonas sp.]|nr:TIGR01841 family phasin [Caldimonas sp.]HEV7577901.1 TIGR01841 family phasin [Caldimonas sp.]
MITLEQIAATQKSVKDGQQLIALQQSFFQPACEEAAAYSRSVYQIPASTCAEVTRVAQAQSADAQAKLRTIVDAAVKSAPAGSENGVALFKSAIAAATTAIESAQKAARQATEAAEANFQPVTKSAVRAAQRGSKARRAA